jgi:glycosyltransferase involved in cell wall biosynthesis
MKDNEIVVSICMITYNNVNYISEAIDGVLIQETTFPYQLILGEDNSTDETRVICEEYALKYPNKILLLPSEKNLGVTPNMIKTIKVCNGKYIAICDGDDYWKDPYKLQKQVDFMEANKNASLCYHKVVRPGFKINEDIFIIKHDLSTAFIPTCSVVFRNTKEIINNFIKHGVGILSNDQFLFYLCSFIGEIKYMDFIGGVYNQTENGISRSIGIKSEKWDLNRILMYSRLLRIAPLKNKVKLIKIAQGSLFNAMTHGIMKPFMTYPYHVLKIIILGLIFHPRYTLFRGKSLINKTG